MGNTGKTVFVLGAGFTRAFLPRAPLLTDDYGAAEIARRLQGFPHARRILLQELTRTGDGRLNIERLLTRLEGGMPYDRDRDATAEVRLLAAELMRAFVRRIESAKSGPLHRDDLHRFAARCLRGGITCVTFNYDDVLDRALYEVGCDSSRAAESRWHPDTGYGFVCRSSATCVHAGPVRTAPTPLLLLKLHGSLNWRLKLGAPRSPTIDFLVHHEDWYVEPSAGGLDRGLEQEHVARHLAPDRVLVPPVLARTAVAEPPILERLWSIASQELEQAGRVIFVGYSLPPADVAAGFLFREACGDLRPTQVEVVDNPPSEDARRDLRAAYRQVFPDLPDAQFVFQDARAWLNAWCGGA